VPGACPNITNTGGADLTHKNIAWRWAAIFMVHSYAHVEFLPSRIYVPEIGVMMMIII
jgi:hypothetical protein